VAGRLDRAGEKALHKVREQLLEFLGRSFSTFDWQMPIARQMELAGAANEPALLLQHGSEERESRNWDFGVLITSSDLISRYKPFALAVVSRALDLAVISTARITPGTGDPSVSDGDRLSLLTRRLWALILHVLGHLNGLSHVAEPANVMSDIETVEDLSVVRELTDDQRRSMAGNLQQIADLRLEEQEDMRRVNSYRFYLRGTWINRHEIADAVWQAEPWEFPMRLMRLTTVAVSSLVLLMVTGETWDLALSQSAVRVAVLFITALIGISI
jgi:predicted Zn-dependent protease